ncbi:MAG: amino acid adenylation domain-containing protein, partial [Pseudomonadota bacterium]|nr:amino acid adenylation domain-containing protein [Pseudomonadota bacterium]
PGLTTTPLATNTGHAKFDLTLELYEREHQLTGWFEYNTTLFTAAVIQRLEQHFQILLEAIVTTPEINLSSLPLLTPLERQHLKYNQWKPQVIFEPEAIEQSLAARFEQQVALYPQKIAVKTRNYEWDYLTLNAQANQVARHLVDLPKRSQQIALLFEHDAPMLVGLLAVLKAGLTYVPLTPDLPIQRLQHIIQDAQISTLVTAQSQWLLAQQLSQGQLPIITIDASLTASCDNLNLPIAADSLAYLLYTSGSTGQPKGVIQNQRNVLHFIRTYTNQLGISANDKLTLFSAYSFDAAVMDIFAALLNGATLYPIDLKKDNNPIAWIKQHAINIFHSTPTVYRHLMGLLTQEERLTAVRWLVLGGEAVYQTDFELYQRHFSEHCNLVNGLGPTESTVTLQYHLTQTTVNSHQAVAVGYPVAETEIVLLDEMGNNTEFCGEIGIKSNYLALGYWQRPELTQAAFIPLTANMRLYRSGDMGLMHADGSFEFIGRKDAQVKIRGIRIELEEIEITLNQHPSINNSVVTVWENNNDKRLIAYLILNPGYTQDLNELRLFLKQRLPEYMLPAHLLILESLPLTANGKVDKRALVLPKQLEQKVQESLVAPRDNFEQQLTQIWKKVLKVQSIGIHDNFFDLGGHSLLTVTLLNKIEHQFGQGIMPLIALFQSPTIAQQAKILKEKNYTTTWKALEIIQPQGNHSPLFFIGSTHYARALAIYIGLEQPIYGLNIFGLQSEQGHILKVESIAKQYIQEI